MLPAIAGAILSLLTGMGPAQVQVTEISPEVLHLVVTYRIIVERYRGGDDNAAVAVNAIAPKDLESILKVINRVPGMPWGQPAQLRLAAMLHTDAALRIVGPDEEHGARRRHLNVAGRILHAPDLPDDPFVPRWYAAVSRALRERDLFGVADDLLELGRRRVPGNPTILYESATVAETVAQGYLPIPDEPAHVNSIEDVIAQTSQRRTRLLDDAAAWLREAVERDATLLLPRLHLGRVETLRAREKDGLVLLEHVRATTKDPAAVYLAGIFSGAAYERLRRLDAAEASYRQAIASFPAGQAAYVALSELLHRSGRSAESQTVLRNLLFDRAEPIREPWWWYLAEPPGVAEDRMAGLRREVRR